MIEDPIKSGPHPVLRDLTKLKPEEFTTGEKVIYFIERMCCVPEGDLIGKPVQLEDFQKLFYLATFDNIEITDTAILSIARKNAKTATIAFLVIVALVGPIAKQNSRIISGAMSREQAAEVFNLAQKCVQLSPKLSGIIRIVASQKSMLGLIMNVEYKAISAEGKTAHGKSPYIAILDEVGQIKGPQDDFVDAITTAQGAYKNPLLILISTQAAEDGDYFSIQIDDAVKNQPKKTVCHVYTAPKELKIMDEKGWKAANPALGKFRSYDDMRKQAEKADRMPSFENTFRNLNLNQRVSTVSPFVSRTVWMENNGQPDDLCGLPVYGGLDLSARTDLTAYILGGRDKNKVLHLRCYFWTPLEGIIERSKRDRVPYDLWIKEGYLRGVPGHTVDYDYVVNEIREINEGLDIKNVAFDRWRIDVFKKSCENIKLNLPLAPHGQGFKDMTPALDALESDLLNKRIRHGGHPVLTMCAGYAIVTKDPAGGRKLDKSKATGKIDGMVALAMCEGAQNANSEEQKDYQILFI